MGRDNEIGFAVRRLFNAIKRDIESSNEKEGIEHIKGINGWAISYFYDNRDKDIFQRDFEERFAIRGSTASRMLKTMEQKGFIERLAVKNDARLKKIVITDKAIENHERIIASIKKREERLKSGINEDEIEIFFNVMKKLTANMEAEND
ncbi:MAG: MarR family transcriptional regulator [Clostridia bacterium]|nr:MarR family transcriptional regulator [Clostridia bacterium]